MKATRQTPHDPKATLQHDSSNACANVEASSIIEGKRFSEPVAICCGRSTAKRIFDVVIALFLIVTGAPLMIVIAIAIKLTSSGPVFFVQTRAGKDGKPFRLYKFRTMRARVDQNVHRRFAEEFITGRSGAFRTADNNRNTYGIANDTRITRIGRVLRSVCLDELPQLLNVIKGEMSIVGPRPPVYHELQHYSASHRRRLSVTPGLTGLWQVSNRSTVSFEEMVKLDLYYIDNWSLWMDGKIVLKTILVVLLGVGRY